VSAVKRFTKLALAFGASLLVSQTHAALDRVGDFALLDEQGEFHQLSRYQHRRAVVMMAYHPNCTTIAASVNYLADLRASFADQDVEFLLLDASGADRSEATQWGLALPILSDGAQLVSAALQIEKAAEVLVFNPERLSLFYRGAATQALGETLQTVLDGSLRDTVKNAVVGCAIEFPVREQLLVNPPDYTTEVAPIIVDNCSECHRWGGAGPFALDSYTALLGWSPMIREVLLNKRMPPMQVDPLIGHTSSAQYLSAETLQTLVYWMDAGAPRGDNPVDPLALVPTEKIFEWELGEPDFIIKASANEIAAVGIQDYLYTEASLPFDRDVWVRAFQYKPGKETVLHHLMTFISPAQENFWGDEADNEISRRRFLGSFIPGNNPATQFNEDTGILIPKGHKLSMQFHYVSNGLASTDETSIGLYFYEQPPKNELLTMAISPRFLIEPYDSNHAMQASYQFQQPVVVTSLRARMNFRGKKMKFAVQSADGKLRDVLSIPAYNYGWQPHYHLSEEIHLNAGDSIHVLGAFDNSYSNPFNPDPSEAVTFGLESYDEMFTGYVTYYGKKSN
jgi:peroxiredoxin